MSVDFNADEIFEMAEQIERNGIKFYTKAAKGFTDEAAVALLKDLAMQEVEHEKTFRNLRKELSSKERQPNTFDPDGVAQDYLRAMAGGYVFDVSKHPSDKLTGNETLAEVLEAALGFEKDAIVFFLGMRDITQGDAGRKFVDDIIKEEMSHVALLTKMLAGCK